MLVPLEGLAVRILLRGVEIIENAGLLACLIFFLGADKRGVCLTVLKHHLIVSVDFFVGPSPVPRQSLVGGTLRGNFSSFSQHHNCVVRSVLPLSLTMGV